MVKWAKITIGHTFNVSGHFRSPLFQNDPAAATPAGVVVVGEKFVELLLSVQRSDLEAVVAPRLARKIGR